VVLRVRRERNSSSSNQHVRLATCISTHRSAVDYIPLVAGSSSAGAVGVNELWSFVLYKYMRVCDVCVMCDVWAIVYL